MSQSDLLTVLLLIATLILWGSTPLMEKLGLQEVSPLTAVFIRSLAITVVLFIAYCFTGKLGELTRLSLRNVLLFSASGVMAGLVGMWTYYYVLRSGITSKIVPIAAAYPLVTAVLGMLLLGEALSVQRMIGIVLTITGIILVKQS